MQGRAGRRGNRGEGRPAPSGEDEEAARGAAAPCAPPLLVATPKERARGGALFCRWCGRDTWQKADPKQVMRSAWRGSATEKVQRVVGADMRGRAVFRMSGRSMRLRGYRLLDDSTDGAVGSATAVR